MPYSREHKARVRDRIIRNASQGLREKGLNGVSVVNVMKSAGLTHGGFYQHFESREAFVVDAVAYTMTQTAFPWDSLENDSTGPDELAATIDAYFTSEHRDNPARGCPLTVLSTDVARSGMRVRRAFARPLRERIDRLAAHLPPGQDNDRRIVAAGAIATMVGSVILARACADPDLSDSILEAGQLAVRSAVRCSDKSCARPACPDTQQAPMS